MKRQKLATIGCIILSIVFSLSFGLFVHFKLSLPHVSNVYEKILYYPEDLYKEYKKEAEGMITRHEYTCQYPAKTTLYSKNGQTTLVIEIGEYDEGNVYSDYLIATVKNFGTNEQEATFERSRESAEYAHKEAENYRTSMNVFTAVFVLILVAFTVYLIKNSIERHYRKVLIPILGIVLVIAIITMMCAMIYFLSEKALN